MFNRYSRKREHEVSLLKRTLFQRHAFFKRHFFKGKRIARVFERRKVFPDLFKHFFLVKASADAYYRALGYIELFYVRDKGFPV